MVEAYQRERTRDFAFMYVMAQMMTAAFQLEKPFVAELLEIYEGELHQDVYTPTAIAKVRERIRAAREEERQREIMAARVASM